jgi:tetratricopeptide (TPR) repeat protein
VNPHIEALLDEAAQIPIEARTEFLDRACPDPAVRAEVEALLEQARAAEHRFDAAIQAVASSLRSSRELGPGDVIGCYRIVSLIGRGGMGTVYLGERADGEIQQRVAIKLLRSEGYAIGWRDRFLKERQLLASLHHPSVVQVIDAGHTADGHPYLVMEYVEGVPIDRYADQIAVREKLKLFVQVCEGVAHAHRHLIIHRDLKPSNILVDHSGRPKLLDFGIAKLLDGTDDHTQCAEQLLTPSYASPEQLRGESQSTATDVYSLGAVLYRLLTGSAPRQGARELAKADVAPSRVSRDVPRDVDFVVGKALRPEADDRYGSVDEMSADLRAVLERRPVQVRAEDFRYCALQRVRRHWLPVAACLLVTASLSGGLLVANRERRLAERRFNDVRQLANKLFDIDVQVAQLQGGSKTRQLIVDTAVEYLKRVASDVRMEPELALELGTAYMRVARVQGVNISPNLGQTEQADQTARKAEALIDSVLLAQPANRTALLRAGQIAHDRMILAGDGHHDEAALRFAQKSVDRLNRYFLTGPLTASSDRMEAQQVIITLINVANRYMKAGLLDDSIRTAGRATELARATNWPTQAGAALMIVAFAHRARGELDQALAAIQESVRVLEPEKGESRVGRLLPYTLALIREGQVLGEAGAISMERPAEAIACLERALKIARELGQRDPSDFASQNRIFAAETRIAAIIRDTRPAAALSMYDDGLRRLEAATANAGTLENEVRTLAAMSGVLLRLDRPSEARQRIDAAFDRLKQANQYPAERIEPGSPAADTLAAEAEYMAKSGHVTAAAARYRELLGMIAAAHPKPETSLETAVALSKLYAEATRLHLAAGQTAMAAELEERHLALWRHWNAALPDNAFIQRRLRSARLPAHSPAKTVPGPS